MSDMDEALRTVLEDCLAVRPGEEVLVVTDPERLAIGRALSEAARVMGAETVLMEMSERDTNGEEPPPSVAAAMLVCDVLIAPTTKSLSHTEARRAACALGARAATMPQITEDMLVRTMAADYAQVRKLSGAVAAGLTAGNQVNITSTQGTDVTLGIEGRAALSDDGDITAAGGFGNLPAGEGFVAPVEGTTSGRIVFDGTIWPIGRLDQPLTVDIEAGYITGMSGPSADEFQAVLEPHGREAFAVAELGIGTNDAARLTGNVLEDEKILGTIHVAFGDNHTFGGTVRVSSHQDGIVLEPNVDIDGRSILRDGRLTV